ncbi:hypothetical protein IEQ34_009806 [Dendrobium chrysotoxum]|uniref:Pentatricopeptide repeat-containing protein n=1 Tax=Dendrobium chrysotoxum TaxID=161865 RepID=A0AAV7H1F5_DENCH|nr:hypothetical protein IEQ34_009806 [Dendrobium chrysotoxum]
MIPLTASRPLHAQVRKHEKMNKIMKFVKRRYFYTLIKCFGSAGKVDKMEYYFKLMKNQGIKPNSITYCAFVSRYAKAKLVEKAPFFIREMETTELVLFRIFLSLTV